MSGMIHTCAPSHQETFDDFVKKQYQITLDFMRHNDLSTVEFRYCKDQLQFFYEYGKHREDDRNDDFDE